MQDAKKYKISYLNLKKGQEVIFGDANGQSVLRVTDVSDLVDVREPLSQATSPISIKIYGLQPACLQGQTLSIGTPDHIMIFNGLGAYFCTRPLIWPSSMKPVRHLCGVFKQAVPQNQDRPSVIDRVEVEMLDPGDKTYCLSLKPYFTNGKPGEIVKYACTPLHRDEREAQLDAENHRADDLIRSLNHE